MSRLLRSQSVVVEPWLTVRSKGSQDRKGGEVRSLHPPSHASTHHNGRRQSPRALLLSGAHRHADLVVLTLRRFWRCLRVGHPHISQYNAASLCLCAGLCVSIALLQARCHTRLSASRAHRGRRRSYHHRRPSPLLLLDPSCRPCMGLKHTLYDGQRGWQAIRKGKCHPGMVQR